MWCDLIYEKYMKDSIFFSSSSIEVMIPQILLGLRAHYLQ
jgi:hypothetical protein